MKIPLSLLALVTLVTSAGATPAPLPIMPAPEHAVRLEGQLPVTTAFTVAAAPGLDPVVAAAVGRTLAAWKNRSGVALRTKLSGETSVADLVIGGARPPAALDAGPSSGRNADSTSSAPGQLPTLGEDESYSLEISSRQAVLKANTASGFIHGLASLQQLLTQGASGWYLPAVSIQDKPRFPWRGLLIDVSRRWKPVDVIKRNLDAMALVKLNVFHIHLTDDQGFRIECKSHPELTAQGSDGLFYTQDQMKDLVAYAAARGIRIVPEFDLPGHATSWLVSHPELASGPGPFLLERHWGVLDAVMDPTNEAAYVLIKDFFTEMAAIFPDPYFHIGGDENNGVEWSANPRIQAFIREHKLGDNPGLQAYFNQRAGAILTSLGKRMIGWDEILHPDLPRGDVIESWRGPESLAQAAQMGFEGFLASGYYLDTCGPAAEYYQPDPLPAGSKLSPEERKRVLGGEVCIWGEWASAEIIDSRVWPRGAAVAERLWSPADVRDPADMYRRLEIIDLRLAEVGTRQNAYIAPGVRRLLGSMSDPASIATVTRFLDLVQPVPQQLEAKQQPTVEQWTQLTGVASLARPGGAVARHFAELVQEYVAAPSAHRRDAPSIRTFLQGSRQIGRSIADRLSPTVAALGTAGPLGFQLADAAEVGLEALAALAAPQPGSHPPSLKLALARLDADAEPHEAAFVSIIEPVRQLVLAADAKNHP